LGKNGEKKMADVIWILGSLSLMAWAGAFWVTLLLYFVWQTR
jgi:hypothetical protein